MKSDIVKRLRASVSIGAIDGDSFERSVCSQQMIEAAGEIERLKALIEQLRGALEKEAECIDGDLTSWCASSPKRIAVITDLKWRQEFIRAALNTEKGQ